MDSLAMWRHHRPNGVDTENLKIDEVRRKWCRRLCESPIQSMIFGNPAALMRPGQTVMSKTEQTMVFREMRFETREKLLTYLLNYDGRHITIPCQGHEERLVHGLFVRPPVHQPTDSELQQMETLKQQISAIWPNQFSVNIKNDYYALKMIIAADINGPLSHIVRSQEIDGEHRNLFHNLMVYLRLTRGADPESLYSHETLIPDPLIKSGAFIQFYVSDIDTFDADAIPLADFLDMNKTVNTTTNLIMTSICGYLS
ncbi:hypothetical protein T484DRAFT_1758710 [Baffinella frigidus]|nr:hypothetical protein T484DRAFT_1758710 [Cryptophyta sp. CCMP2293]